MAVTTGHGNPHWTKDETILVLNLYFQLDGKIRSANDERIVNFSNELRSYPFHINEAKNPSFRNPDGVVFKLQNIRQVATGKGLDHTSKMDKAIWNEYGNNKHLVEKLAEDIRKGIVIIQNETEIIEDDEYFNEGRIITELHKRRERSPKLREKKIEYLLKHDSVMCEICGLRPVSNDKDIMYSIYECHHIEPLSAFKEKLTSISDIAFLCANCHKMIHKLIVKKINGLV
ncbi:HNH endonuclease [Brucepastera parasyntrophica]|uniref:HNH endonuclease n=1 Tax=Brucepastera parasyntrophica TaxID=2880008 RepID=UPI00210BBC9D|nr:HNH endonuclease [Brucepastera parasyntrophica]ULQ61032.1 HNH endonuclease [Brucepastera parasyntrophica]